MKRYLVYSLWNTTSENIRYIGYTKQKMNRRFNQHLNDIDRGNLTYRKSWFKKCISENIVLGYTILHSFETESEALLKEIELIAYYKNLGYRLTNLTDGGIGVPNYKFTEKDRKKVSDAAKKRIKEVGFTDQHKLNISKAKKGVIFSVEHKEAISKAKKGTITTEETKEKMRNKVVSEETRLKMSVYRKGKSVHPNSEKAMREGHKNWKPSEEHKEKLRQVHLGSKASDETKLKMSESQKNRDVSTYNPSTKSVTQKDMNSNVIKIWNSIRDAARDGFNCGHITSCCKGNRKQHKGFIWEYSL